ncbi:MAG: GNAT family N-acetyltransferase [Burkholderiaceae bacterium]|nr:GNAT family N-acetyltransferase [Burkholderiaceae bacterium]
MLRAPRAEDLDALYALHADPVAARFDVGGPMQSLDEARALLAECLAHWDAHQFGYWVIALREQPDEVIGFGGVRYRVLDGVQVLSLYFRFMPQAWGRGYASEMALAAMEMAFGSLHAPSVLALVRSSNMPSRKTLERLGLHLKGSLTDCPGQQPSLLFEMSAADYASVPRRLPEPTPFGA